MILFQRKKYREKTDGELVALYKEKASSLCMEILYDRYAHLVMGTCLKYLKNQHDAEDLTMKIFEELPQKIMRHSIDYFKSWLYSVTRNECLQLLRKNRKEIPMDLIPTIIENESLESTAEKEIKLLLLEQALDTLKPEQKECIRLFFLEEKSYLQISELLQLPLSNVKSYIQNGKRNLKIQLETNNAFKNQK